MARTVIDDFFKYMKKNEEFMKILKSKKSVEERKKFLYDELEKFLKSYNLSKSGVGEFVFQNMNVFLYTQYLFQNKENVNFGICEYFKMWYNKRGEQRRCKLKKGYHQINCFGDLKKCEMKIYQKKE